MSIQKQYKVVQNKQDLKEMVQHIISNKIIAYDVESNGLNVRKDKIIGFSITGEAGFGFYLPISEWNVKKEYLQDVLIDGVKGFDLASFVLKKLVGKKLIMHNASFDTRITLSNFKIDLLSSLYADTMLMYHTINEEGVPNQNSKFGLKQIAIHHQKDLGLDVEKEANEEQLALKESIQKNAGSVTKSNYELYKADMPIIGIYACADTDLTFRIFKYLEPKLIEEGLHDFFYIDEVMPLYKEVTILMEANGVKLDIPLMEKIGKEIDEEKSRLEQSIFDKLKQNAAFRKWLITSATNEFPVKNSGKFIQEYIKLKNINLPKTKSGNYSTSKGNLAKLLESAEKQFLIEGNPDLVDNSTKVKICLELWKEKNEGYININSNKQLGELVFDFMGVEPISYTDKGAAQFNNDTIEELSKSIDWLDDLRIYKKLSKIRSTYINRFLENQEDGYYYFYYKQHGTISGRYGSDAQQLPRPMEDGDDDPIIIKYVNTVRRFFIADEGRAFIDSDYESLEPFVFSEISNEEKIKNIFRKKHDFYSTIAIDTEGLKGVSADKKADNYLKKIDPTKRQEAKSYCLDGHSGIITPNGLKLLKDIKIGDFVRSKNTFNKVTDTFTRKVKQYYEIVTKFSFIICTEDHKFWCNDRWVEAQHLNVADYLLYSIDGKITLSDMIVGTFKVDEPIQVYDITVENEHNFYANGILVHNCLGIPYGMGPFALGKNLEIPTKEAKTLIDKYLNAYPNLAKWMQESKEQAQQLGYVKTKVGRIRHLQKVKFLYEKFGDNLMDWEFREKLSKQLGKDTVLSLYRDYKNGINNSRNFQIQSLAASIVNRAALACNRKFKELGINAYAIAQIHDQIIFDSPIEEAERCKAIIQDLMENTTKLSIDLKAPPEIAYNWAEGH